VAESPSHGSTGGWLALFPSAPAIQVTQEGLVVVRTDRTTRRRRWGLSPGSATAAAPTQAVAALDRPEHGVQQRRHEQQPHHDPDHLPRLSLPL
jgi:putative SOS response-associated peptidase YedK